MEAKRSDGSDAMGSDEKTAPIVCVCVYAGASDGLAEEAARLARQLGAPLVDDAAGAADDGGFTADGLSPLQLRFDADGVALLGAGMQMRGDFTRLLPRLRPSNLSHELLVRAAKGKSIRSAGIAVDATAGMGEDALLLAAAGFSVTMYEHNPVVAALLRDALRRAAGVPDLAPAVARMELREAESLDELPRLGEGGASPDVVLLDPMFPARTKSASVKKKAQLLQCLESPCADEAALLGAALAARPRRVVVKRPPKGPFLAGIKPAYSLEGKAVRYDVVVPAP